MHLQVSSASLRCAFARSFFPPVNTSTACVFLALMFGCCVFFFFFDFSIPRTRIIQFQNSVDPVPPSLHSPSQLVLCPAFIFHDCFTAAFASTFAFSSTFSSAFAFVSDLSLSLSLSLCMCVCRSSHSLLFSLRCCGILYFVRVPKTVFH